MLQLVSVASKAIKYLNEIRNAPRERFRLAQELKGLNGILTKLENRGDEAKANGDDEWLRGFRSLTVKSGPIEQLKSALELIVDRVKPVSKFKKIGKALLTHDIPVMQPGRRERQ